MPRISEFYGLAIYMYYSDHAPPHFHAIYGGFEAAVAIETGKVVHGYLPRRALSLIEEWAGCYRSELRADWQRARGHLALEQIPPLV
jgi:hypothetical protein